MCKTTKMAAVAIESALYFIPSPGTYASYLAEAALRLRIAPFGDWRAPPESTNWNADDRFDKSYWTWVDDVKYTRVLKLISGKKPADAIDAILSNPDKWKIDCDHTVQIANLYAIRKVLGSEAFNLLVGDGMLLRTRESTGLNTKRHVGRDGPTKPWRVVTDFDPRKVKPDPDPLYPTLQKEGPFTFGPPLPDQRTEQLLAEAPAGSRVRWTNLDANLFDSFRHENAVKLRNNRYAAGGLVGFDVVSLISGQFDGSEVQVELASRVNEETGRTGHLEAVFIDEIEEFDQNPIPPA